jgi:serine/threonine protein phosphatase PrpC
MTEQSTATSVVSSTPLVLRAVLRTDVGRVRSENQDFGILTSPQDEQDAHPGGRLLIVADGMGGHRGGATASRIAAETVKSQYLGFGTDDIGAALLDALTSANSRVFNESQTNVDLRGMGTTTSALVVRGNQAWFAHVGDSRIYMVRGGEIKQLTEDHSLVASMVREGLLTTKEAENHPRRNVLQRSIGVSDQVDVDVRGPIEVQEGDLFILCSDGLHGVVKPDEILEVVTNMSIDQAADQLVKRALERGGPDNVTVIVGRVERMDDDTTVRDNDRTLFEDTVTEDPRPAPEIADRGSQIAGNQIAENQIAAEAAGDSALRSAIGDPRSDSIRDPRSGRAGRVAKWALLFVIVLGAAGAWLFFTQQQMFQNKSSSSTR